MRERGRRDQAEAAFDVPELPGPAEPDVPVDALELVDPVEEPAPLVAAEPPEPASDEAEPAPVGFAGSLAAAPFEAPFAPARESLR
jgi:hypothetical protein